MDKANKLDPKMFPQIDNPDCTHTIGVYRSGRCRACGFKLLDNLRKRAHDLGLYHLVQNKRQSPEDNW